MALRTGSGPWMRVTSPRSSSVSCTRVLMADSGPTMKMFGLRRARSAEVVGAGTALRPTKRIGSPDFAAHAAAGIAKAG